MERSWEYVVVLDFWTFQDSGDEKTGRLFVDALSKFGFVPTRFGDRDPPRRKFDSSSPYDMVREWAKRPGQLIIERLGELGFQALIHLSDPQKRPVLITFALHDHYFASEENSLKFLEFSEELYGIFSPFYGCISHSKDSYSKTVVATPIELEGRTIRSEAHFPVVPTRGLPGIFWANFLGPEFVSFFSKGRIQTAPAYKVKELSYGGYLLLTSRSPLDYPHPTTKKLEAELVQYLGKDSVFDKRDPDRSLRSPFPSDPNVAPAPRVARQLRSTVQPFRQLRQCPECGEASKLSEISRDRVNDLVGFKCQNCGAVWAVHTSLL